MLPLAAGPLKAARKTPTTCHIKVPFIRYTVQGHFHTSNHNSKSYQLSSKVVSFVCRDAVIWSVSITIHVKIRVIWRDKLEAQRLKRQKALNITVIWLILALRHSHRSIVSDQVSTLNFAKRSREKERLCNKSQWFFSSPNSRILRWYPLCSVFWLQFCHQKMLKYIWTCAHVECCYGNIRSLEDYIDTWYPIIVAIYCLPYWTPTCETSWKRGN